MISPKVTLITEGHPVEPAERYDFVTVAPIVIEADVWIGAAATVTQAPILCTPISVVASNDARASSHRRSKAI